MKKLIFVCCILLLAMPAIAQQTNIVENGDLENAMPFFWEMMGEANATLEWATDGAHAGTRSLKIDKAGTSGEAGWKTHNQAQTYWNSMDATTYEVSAWVKTEGVNTNPGIDDEKFYIEWEFLAGGAPIVSNVMVEIPQDQASTDWTQITGLVVLPQAPDEAYCYFKAGSLATGTVWADDFNIGSDPWTAGFFGSDLETPAGWMQWHAMDGLTDLATVEYTDEEAHSGMYSAKLADSDDGDDEIVFYSEPYPAEPNAYYRLSVWVKWEGVNTDPRFIPTNIVTDRDNDRISVCFFYHRSPLETNWDLTGGDQFFYMDQRETDGDWTLYDVISKAPEDAAGISIRARFTSFPTGTVYFDDFSIEKLTLTDSNIIENGDLENNMPFFWSMYNEDNADLEWATDEARGGTRSLKIHKTTTGGEAGWNSHNQAQMYWNSMDATTYTLSAWVKTDGVNTNPAGDDERIWLEWEFLVDSVPIVSNIKTYVDQSSASMDWTEFTDLVVLPQAPEEVYCFVRMGHNATGTVWFDDFNLGSDPWTAGFFGSDLETPAGWMQWHAMDGLTDLATVEYTDEEAHSGMYSAKLADFDDGDDEVVFYSEPHPVYPDGWFALSGWVKWEGLNTDEKFMPSNIIDFRDNDRVSFCFFYHRAPLETTWDLTGGDQFFYIDQREADGDWTHFMVISQAPEDAAGVSIRARFTSFPTGTVYFDDFMIQEVTVEPVSIEDNSDDPSVKVLPSALLQNYPNPFTPGASTTAIRYFLDAPGFVNLSVYNAVGQRVANLEANRQNQGWHVVNWNGTTDQGYEVPSGVYFYRLQTDKADLNRRMVIVR